MSGKTKILSSSLHLLLQGTALRAAEFTVAAKRPSPSALSIARRWASLSPKRPCTCPWPRPWEQGRRGAHKQSGQSPTVRAERRAAAAERKRTTDRSGSPSAPVSFDNVFPADPSTLLVPLRKAIEALEYPLTAEACVNILSASRRVHQNQAKTAINEAALKRDYHLTPYQMHSVALLVLFMSVSAAGGGSRQLMPLATTLLHLAGSLSSRPGGYLPSTLTVLGMFGQGSSSNSSRVRESYFYQSAEKRFLDYLAQSQKQNSQKSQTSGRPGRQELVMRANAYTQAGLLAESGGNPGRALRWLRAARSVGRDMDILDGKGAESSEHGENAEKTDTTQRKPRWDWERSCLEAIGRLQADELRHDGRGTFTQEQRKERQEQYADARAAVQTAALALDSGKACLLLATEYASETMTESKDEKEQEIDTMLQRAAAAAQPEASRLLAERAEARAAREASAAPELRLLAEEWRAIADMYEHVEAGAVGQD